QEDVQQAGPAHHELEDVQRHQQAGDAAQQRRAGHLARDPADERIDSVPNTAAENRQPREFRPKIHPPPAIIHLPSGGCTTNSGVLCTKMFVCPAWTRLLTLLTHLASTPYCR